VAAPFLASSNPDGLQHTANMVVSSKINSMIAPITLLFPNYAIPGMGEAGKVAAIVIGLAAILILWAGITRVIRKA
jgi:spore maturation protein SpmA